MAASALLILRDRSSRERELLSVVKTRNFRARAKLMIDKFIFMPSEIRESKTVAFAEGSRENVEIFLRKTVLREQSIARP